MSLIIPIKRPLKINKLNKCDFCGECRVCVESLISHKSICFLCHQNAKEIIGAIPASAVQCLHCHKFNHIIVQMDNNTVINYKSIGLDLNGITLYVMSGSSGSFSSKNKCKSAKCGHCNTEIPLYVLNRNDYLTILNE